MIPNLSHCLNFLHRLFNIFDQTSFISRLATRHAALLNVRFAFWESSQPHLLHPPLPAQPPPPPPQAQPPAPLLFLGERRPRGMNIVSGLIKFFTDETQNAWRCVDTSLPSSACSLERWGKHNYQLTSKSTHLQWNKQVISCEGCWSTHSYSSSTSDMAAIKRNPSGEQNWRNEILI